MNAPHAAPNNLSTAELRQRTVMLFGEVLADVFPDRTVLGGAPFNVACHLRAFGLNPVLVSRVGDDALREQVLERMGRNGMSTLGIQNDKGYPTGQVQVHVEEGGHRFEILPMQAYDFIHPAMTHMAALSARPALVYFGTLSQRNETSRRALKSLLRSTDAARFLDINLRAPWYDRETLEQSLRHADYVKLNADELDELAEMFDLAGSGRERAAGLVEQFGLRRVIVTCGEAGAWQLDANGEHAEADTQQVPEVVDTVGAGDGFAAVCMLGMLRNWPPEIMLARANAFAAAICGIRGAVPERTDFYEPYTGEWKL